MLTLAKKLNRVLGRISVEQLAEVGYPYKPFDRRHTPNSNWPRIPGVRMLYQSTLGIVGLGRDRPRDGAAGVGLRHAHALSSAHAAAGGAGTRVAGDLCAARHADGGERLGRAGAADLALDARA